MESRRDKKTACYPVNKRTGQLSRKAALEEQRCIVLSNANFHLEILNKYRKSRNQPFNFPMMLLLKNTRPFFSSQNNINILFKLYFDHLHLVSSSIAKSINNIQQQLAWFKTEKLLPQLELTLKLNVIQRNISKLSYFSSQPQACPFPAGRETTPIFSIRDQPGSSQSRRIRKKTFNLTIKRHSFAKKPFFFNLFTKSILEKTPPTYLNVYNFFASDHIRAKLASYPPYASFIQATTGIPGLQALLVHKAPMDSGSRSGSPGMKGWEKTPFDHNQVFTNYVRRGLKTMDAVLPPIQRTADINTNIENFSFRESRKVEQEIEEIKKIALETKKALSEKSFTPHSVQTMDLKRHLDINHLSDQVYYNIERRIKMERERRGV